MTDLHQFREETRRFLLDSAPPRMRSPVRHADELCWGGRKGQYPDDVRRWLAVMAERGFTAPSWPKRYGGAELTAAQAKVLDELMAELGLRLPLIGFGLSMLGPLLLTEGSEEQKLEHLPAIVRGEIRWCQGYSEPAAGSDLASLQTRAVLDGDDLVVTGHKIWTSYGDKSDWMFLLVRTDPAAKKQEGITFVLMDMAQPGVTVRPIKLISGTSPFCETFFESARAHRRNVIGPWNGGWSMARTLLGYERTMIAEVFKEKDDAERLVDIARRYLGSDGSRIADPLIRDRIAQLEMDQACLDLTLQRSRDGARAGHQPGPEASIFKYYGTELNQRRRDLLAVILGPQALGEPTAKSDAGFTEEELKITRDWLRSRGNTIEGGTSEIQLNIIAKRVLGL